LKGREVAVTLSPVLFKLKLEEQMMLLHFFLAHFLIFKFLHAQPLLNLYTLEIVGLGYTIQLFRLGYTIQLRLGYAIQIFGMGYTILVFGCGLMWWGSLL